jgi:hypothetical protein
VTFTTVALYVVLVGFVLYKRMTPHPVGTPKKLLLLPVILTAIGLSDLSHAHLGHIDIAVTVVAGVVSLAGGAVRGALDRFSSTDGYLAVRWGAASVGALVATLAARVVVDLVGIAAGGTWAGASRSLLFTLGLTLVAEAGVVHLRAQSSGVPLAPAESGRSGRTW